MTERTEEDLAAEVERTKALCAQIKSLLERASDNEARNALAATIAQRCLGNANPDREFLVHVDMQLAAFREMSNTTYRNQDPSVS